MSLWADNMLVPNLATHQANAEEWINYYYDPKVAAKLAAWDNYICPVEGAQEEMHKIDTAGRQSQLIFPTDEMLKDTCGFMALERPSRRSEYERRLGRCHIWLSTPRPPRRTESPPTGLELRGLTKDFGAFKAVDDLDLDVPTGSFFALLGPSGCGKTTTLRMVAGLETPTSGTITLAGKDITFEKPYRRPVNTVFQNYALFPHLDIFENVAFGLRRRKESRTSTTQVHRDARAGRARPARPASGRPSSPVASSSGSRWPGR